MCVCMLAMHAIFLLLSEILEHWKYKKSVKIIGTPLNRPSESVLIGGEFVGGHISGVNLY